MTDAWRVANIESFEQVPVAAGTALLRVAAVSAFRVYPDDPRPKLVADDGHVVSRFVSVPAPIDEGGLLRCAYSVPVDVVTLETVFSLEFDDGLVIALPHPTAGYARLARRSGSSAAPARRLLAETDERRSQLAPKLTALSEELEGLRHEVGILRAEAELGRGAQARTLVLHHEVVEAQAELQAMRDLARFSPTITDAPDGAASDAEAAGVELEQARRALSDSEVRAGEAGARADSMQSALNAEHEQLLELRERFARLEREARDAGEQFTAAERERDAALTARRELEQSVEPLREARSRAETELRDLHDQLHKMSVERDELRRQASAFDGIAVKARERAAAAESEHQKSSGRLAELETWTRELERRLADTTTQLAEARAGAQFVAPEPVPAPRVISDAELEKIRRSAVAEAHDTAERDLADSAKSR